MENTLRINLKERAIEKISLNFENEKKIEKDIKKNIKKFSILPIILEKIVIEYDNQLTMITEIKNIKGKKDKGFYFKGYFLNSNAVILKASFSDDSEYIEYSGINDIELSQEYLSSRIIFDATNATASKKAQIKIIELISKCGVNPFEILSFYDNKYIMRVKKIIDAVDIIASKETENTKEILKSVKKTLQATSQNKNPQEKRITCIDILQNMCRSIAI